MIPINNKKKEKGKKENENGNENLVKVVGQRSFNSPIQTRTVCVVRTKYT